MVQDLCGMTFGFWNVLKDEGSPYVLCKCVCGKEKLVYRYDLIRKRSMSCGCSRNISKSKSYCKSYDPLYSVWYDMMRRCYNPKTKGYPYYGAKGIIVCEEWHDFPSFKKWAEQNGYVVQKKNGRNVWSIDRIDYNGNYSPENCRIANVITQSNNKSSNHYVTLNGEKKTIAEWARIYEVSPYRIATQIQRGWSESDAIQKPINVDKKYCSKTMTYNGETHTLKEWSEILEISYSAIKSRRQKGWDDEKIITTPPLRKRHKNENS